MSRVPPAMAAEGQADAAGSGVRTYVVTRAEDLAALAGPWRALGQRCPGASIFVSWDWAALWWKNYGRGRELRILVATQAGRVVGVLPLYIERGALLGPLRGRMLRLLGTGGDTTPDYLDPPIEPGLDEAVAAALAGRLAGELRHWDAVQLSDLDQRAAFTRALIRSCRDAGCLVESHVSARIPYARLPHHWDEYLESLTAHRRQAVRQIRRKFERTEGARFRVCDDAQEVAPLFERLTELHRLRFGGRAGSHGFSSPEYLSFHGELVRVLQGLGSLRLYVLESGTNVIAVLYCFRHGQTMFHFQGGFHPDYAKLSIGQLLLGYAIESAIAEGCRVFDALRGDYSHKRHFFKDTRGTIQVSAFRPGWPTWVQRLRGVLKRVRTWSVARRPGAGTPVAAMLQEAGE